jgi:hypothetical protein
MTVDDSRPSNASRSAAKPVLTRPDQNVSVVESVRAGLFRIANRAEDEVSGVRFQPIAKQK